MGVKTIKVQIVDGMPGIGSVMDMEARAGQNLIDKGMAKRLDKDEVGPTPMEVDAQQKAEAMRKKADKLAEERLAAEKKAEDAKNKAEKKAKNKAGK